MRVDCDRAAAKHLGFGCALEIFEALQRSSLAAENAGFRREDLPPCAATPVPPGRRHKTGEAGMGYADLA
jgi:hypothetical protein